MRPISSDDVIRMKDSLGTLQREIGQFLNSGGYQVPPATQAAAELAANPRFEEHLRTAYYQGRFLIESAVEHLAAFESMLNEPTQTIAPWTCVRAILEASAVSAWLL